MEDTFVTRGQSQHKVQEVTNLHHFRVELFYVVIDMQIQELNDYFNEVNTNLLLYLACVSPYDLFSDYDNKMLIEFVKFYPEYFSDIESSIYLKHNLKHKYLICVLVSSSWD